MSANAEELSPEALRFVRKHHHQRTPTSMAKELGVPVRAVKRAVKQLQQEAASGPGEGAGNDWASRAVGLLVAVVVLAVVTNVGYATTWDASFHFDDSNAILTNPYVRDLDAAVGAIGNARWLTYLTLALNRSYNVSALGPEGEWDVGSFHAVNIAIHFLTGLLLYAFGLVVFATPALRGRLSPTTTHLTALGAAALFCAHPLGTQAVTYIVQRAESLCALLYLATLAAYAAGRVRHAAQADALREEAGDAAAAAGGIGLQLRALGRAKAALAFYGLAMLCCVLAMGAKEVAASAPLAVLLVEVCFFGWSAWLLALAAPMGIGVLALPLVYLYQGVDLATLATAEKPYIPFGRTEYLFAQFGVLLHYLRLVFLPYGQNLDHDVPWQIGPSSFVYLVMNLGVMAGGVWAYRRGERLVAFAIGAFYCVLAVTSLPVFLLPDIMFEHRVYLPLALLLLAALGTVSLRVADRPGLARFVLFHFVVVLCCVLTGLTYRRNLVWENEETLWADTAAKSPGKARPHSNHGLAIQRERSPDRAKRGRDLARAEECFKRAIEADPDFVRAHDNLGMIYVERGVRRVEEWQAAQREAQALKQRGDPAGASARLAQGESLRNDARNWFGLAEKVFLDVIERRPVGVELRDGGGKVEGWVTLEGSTYRVETADGVKEIPYAEVASVTGDFVAHSNLANMYHGFLGRYWDQKYTEEAIRHLEVVELITSSQPITSAILGDLYLITGMRQTDSDEKLRRLARSWEKYGKYMRLTEKFGHDKRPYVKGRLSEVYGHLQGLGRPPAEGPTGGFQ